MRHGVPGERVGASVVGDAVVARLEGDAADGEDRLVAVDAGRGVG